MAEITVLIPHRNDNELLGRAIASVTLQGMATECDVLVLDNNSERVPKVPPGVGLVHHLSDMGIPLSLTEGYRISRTRFCCFVGADDTIEPDWIHTATEMLKANEWAAFVAPDSEHDLRWPDIGYNNYMHMGAVYRREAVLKLGGYRHVPFFDWDLWIRLAKAGYRGISLNRHFYNWTQRPNSDSTKISGDDYARFRRELQEAHEVPLA